MPLSLPSFSHPAGRSRPALLLAGLLCLLAAGCATGGVVMLAEIAGGEKIRVPLGKGGPEMTNEGGVQINAASFTINADKKLVFMFAFTDQRSRPLRTVTVEDVTDSVGAPMVSDPTPKPATPGSWKGESSALDLTDPRLGWMATISNSLRVFRFTLAFADGQTLVIHQGAMYPAGTKAAIRQMFGQNY